MGSRVKKRGRGGRKQFVRSGGVKMPAGEVKRGGESRPESQHEVPN